MEFSCALGIAKIDDSLSNLVNPRTKNRISCEISVVQTPLAASIYFYPSHDEKFDFLHLRKNRVLSSNTSFKERAIPIQNKSPSFN